MIAAVQGNGLEHFTLQHTTMHTNTYVIAAEMYRVYQSKSENPMRVAVLRLSFCVWTDHLEIDW